MPVRLLSIPQRHDSWMPGFYTVTAGVNPFGPFGKLVKLAPNVEAGLVATKIADRNMAMGLASIAPPAWSSGPSNDNVGLPFPRPEGWGSAIAESASRVLQSIDTFGTSICQGNPTFTVNAGTLVDGFVRAFVGTCTFAAGSGVTIVDRRVSTVTVQLPPAYRAPEGAGILTAPSDQFGTGPATGCTLAQTDTPDVFALTSF